MDKWFKVIIINLRHEPKSWESFVEIGLLSCDSSLKNDVRIIIIKIIIIIIHPSILKVIQCYHWMTNYGEGSSHVYDMDIDVSGLKVPPAYV
mgnify:CR=1 FL=1